MCTSIYSFYQSMPVSPPIPYCPSYYSSMESPEISCCEPYSRSLKGLSQSTLFKSCLILGQHASRIPCPESMKGMNNSRYVLVPSRIKLYSMTQLALRNKTQGEGLWRSLSCDVTGACACPWQGSSSFPKSKVSGLLQILDSLFIADSGSTASLGDKKSLCLAWCPSSVSVPWGQRPLQSLPTLFFCLKTGPLTFLAFPPESQNQVIYFYNKAPCWVLNWILLSL